MPDEGENQKSHGCVIKRMVFSHSECNEESQCRCNVKEILRLKPLKDCKMRCDVSLESRKVAFTLAEVLITLGIIGVVAALMLPSVIHNIQKVVLKNQVKKAYSNFYNAIRYTQVQNGAPYECFYWGKKTYGSAICTGYNEYGSCNKWTLADGSALPADYNGKNADCRKFTEDLMKTLKVVKFCEKNALKNGCITDDYRGIDEVEAERYPDKIQDPNRVYGDKRLKEINPAFIAADGSLYSKNYNMSTLPLFMIDVNGHKGPNKWGYDIFVLILYGDELNGITDLKQAYVTIEKGGMSLDNILLNK